MMTIIISFKLNRLAKSKPSSERLANNHMYISKTYLHDTMSEMQEHPNTAVEYIGLTKLQIWRLTLQTYTKQD